MITIRISEKALDALIENAAAKADRFVAHAVIETPDLSQVAQDIMWKAVAKRYIERVGEQAEADYWAQYDRDYAAAVRENRKRKR